MIFTNIDSIYKEQNIKLPGKLNIIKEYTKNYMMMGSLLKGKYSCKKK